MIDVSNKESLRVFNEGDAGPYLMIPLEQLAVAKELFDQNGIGYWVEENAISLNGSPYIAFVEFGRDADAETIQALLDSVA